MDDKVRDLIVGVYASNSDPAEWMVSGPKYDDEELTVGDLVWTDRESAIADAKQRATWVTDRPVRIEVAEGDGHEAEEWVVDEYTSFVQPD